jgi:hypothetical protein
MRRFRFTIAASITALALIPAGAMASGHAKHHKRHHAARHHRVHHSVRHVQFGAASTTPSSPSGTSTSPSSPTTTPSSDTAGTVKSFTGGVLTIVLTDGTTMVSGKVSDSTEIECEAVDMQGDMRSLHADGGSGHGGGDNSGDNSNSGRGDQGNGGGDNGDDNGNDNGDDNGDDHGDDHGTVGQSCTAANLVAGAMVRSAELSISSSTGSIWDKVELVG